MKKRMILGVLVLLTFFFVGSPVQGNENTPDAKERCPVCGMFVAKYPQWLATLTSEKGKQFYFDGVKDMMAYFFTPEDFGATAEQTISKVEVKDYYSQKWIDGKNAWYVVGSDVLGPMGHELIPFGSEAAAQNFLKDHHGTEILIFTGISSKRIASMRQGHKMKMMKKK
jgi:copper chaperone NosL